MLIPSPRHSRADLDAWAVHERTDAVNVERFGRKLESMAARAIAAIVEWSQRGRGYCGVSWGKDSVVVAHLVVRADVSIPIVWVRVDDHEQPDCPLVRDAFLALHPVDYHEVHAPIGARRMSAEGFRLARRRFGDRHISGVRSEESTTRRMLVAQLGVDGGQHLRPIARWTAEHVYAYLHAHSLPVHPAYACSLGGRLDRARIRVGALGGQRGEGHGRAEWEQRYYPEVDAVWRGEH